MKRWPLSTLPGILDLDGTRYQKVPARPGAIAEYEELRGSRRVFVLWRNERLEYSYDENRQAPLSLKL